MENKQSGVKGQVINIKTARTAKNEEKRRKYERVLFRNILGAYCVVEGRTLKAVELVDLSSEGMSFQLPSESKNKVGLEAGKEFLLRLYFSQDTYVGVTIKVRNVRDCIENGASYIRYGCEVDTSAKSYDAYAAFVDFLASFAESAQIDKGDLKLSYF